MFRRQLRFFKVVRSEEDEYAVWPASAEHPPGWYETGHTGNEEECRQFVEKKEQSRPLFLWRR
jgi:uncharacterized protein YbdZ (MbtH family)